MPAHDWTRVSAGTFHSFHTSWITHIMSALNNGILPRDYYALSEQVAGSAGPDVLTLQRVGSNGHGTPGGPIPADAEGVRTVTAAPPAVDFTAATEMDQYVLRQKSVVIRHESDDRVIALIEILSPGNKASRHAVRSFVTKAASALYLGYHLLLADLFPPGPRDPQGIHGAIWEEIGEGPYMAPADRPLTLAAYSSGEVKTAYVQPFAVGDVLVEMPLFLDAVAYVPVPLETTYQRAWHDMPQRWREVLENGG